MTAPRLSYPEREDLLAPLCARFVDAFHTAVSAGLEDSHFTQPVAAAIWTATRELREAGKKVGFVELTEKLRGPMLGAAQAMLKAQPPTLSEADVIAHVEKIVAAGKARAAARGTAEALRELEAAPDPQEALGVFLDRAFELTMAQQQTRRTATVSEALTNIFNRIIDPANRRRTITGIPTGIAGIDDRLRGCQMGKVTIIAARPGVGKTAFTTSMVAKQVVSHDPERTPMPPCFFVSLEMPTEELVLRVTQDITKMSEDEICFGDMPPQEDWQRISRAADLIARAPLDINDQAGQTVEQIAAAVWRWRRRRWPKGVPKGAFGYVVIDYLTRIKKSRAGDTLQDRVTHSMEVLTTLAKDTGLAIILLSQLTRLHVNEGRRPDMGDLKGGGEIEENAFAVVLLHPLGRNEDSAAGKKWRGLVAALIDKNRAGQPGKSVMLHFEGALYSFRAWNMDTDGRVDDVLGELTGRAGPPVQKQPRKPKQEALPSAPPDRGPQE